MTWGIGRKTWSGEEREPAGIMLRGIVRNILEMVPGGVIRAGKVAYEDDEHVGFWLGVTDVGAAVNIGGGGLGSFKWDTQNGARFFGSGAGLTGIDGRNIQTGTISAEQIMVESLSALSSDLGAVRVTDSLDVMTADGVVRGFVDEELQWQLDQYGLALVALEDPQNLRFILPSGQVVGDVGVYLSGEDRSSLAVIAKPVTVTTDVNVQVAAHARMDAGLRGVLAQLTLKAPAGGTPAASFAFRTPSAGMDDLARIEAISNTDRDVVYIGRGVEFAALVQTSTTPSVPLGRWVFAWDDVRHQYRRGVWDLYVNSAAGERHVLRAIGNRNSRGLYAPEGIEIDVEGRCWGRFYIGDAHVFGDDASFSLCDGRVTAGSDGVVQVAGLRVGEVQVVGEQQPAIVDPEGGDVVDVEARAVIGEILAALRAHGLIAS